MKKRFLSILLSIVSVVSVFAASACKGKGQTSEETSDSTPQVTFTDHVIASEGKTDYKIVIADDAEYNERLASEELTNFLKQATDATVPVVLDSEVSYSDSAKFFVLGNTDFSSYAKADTSSLDQQGYVLKTVGQNMFVLGADSYGVLYGVYDLLKVLIDFEVYRYDEITVTEKSLLKLPDLNMSDAPDVAWREPTYGSVWDVQAGTRMRFQRKIWMTQNANFVHNTFGEYLPPSTYMSAHPNWYSDNQSQLCYTAHGNEEDLLAMQEIVLSRMKDLVTIYFSKGDYRSLLSFTHEDTRAWCGCKSCGALKEQYGTDAGAVVRFINPVAEQLQAWLEETYPGHPVYITIFAYYATENAPVKEVDGTYVAIDETVIPEDNVMILYAPITADYYNSFNGKSNSGYKTTMDKWASISKNMGFWLYQANFQNYMLWFDTFNSIQENYQLLKDNGAIYFFDQGRHNAGSLTGFDDLKVYLNSKLMWNVDADINQLTQAFFDNYFKDASKPMMEYYQSYRSWSNYIMTNLGAVGNIYATAEKRHLPLNVLQGWLEKINEAYAAIEPLKKSNETLYEKLENRITQESMAIRYHLIELHSASFDTATLLQMKLSFKEDVKRLGFMYSCEWATFDSDVFPKWGV